MTRRAAVCPPLTHTVPPTTANQVPCDTRTDVLTINPSAIHSPTKIHHQHLLLDRIEAARLACDSSAAKVLTALWLSGATENELAGIITS